MSEPSGRIGASRRNEWEVREPAISLARRTRDAALVTVAAQPTQITIDLGRTAIVVVDMQNDFCHPAGWLASIGVDVAPARAPIDVLAAELPRLRLAGAAIVWLNWGARADRANLPPGVLHVYDPDGRGIGIGSIAPTGSPVLERGSWGAAVVEELVDVDVAAASDIWIHKHRMSGFWDTELDSVLRNLDVTTILFAGVNVDQCVLATLIDAACIGYDVVLLEDASATTSPGFCWDATVYNVRQCFGFTASLADIADALATQDPG